jgi:hypothetical protein
MHIRQFVFGVVLAGSIIGLSSEAASPLTLESSVLWSDAGCVNVKDSLTFCAYGYGIVVYDFSSTSNIVEVGRTYLPMGEPVASRLVGEYLYVVAAGGCGASLALHVFSTNSSGPPSWLSSTEIPTLNYPADMDVAGGYAYVATNSLGLRIIDVGDPFNPVEVGSYGAGTFNGIRVLDTLAYATNPPNGALTIINVAVPASPSLVGVFDTTAYLGGLDISGQYVFASADFTSLLVVDISNPALPATAAKLTADPFNSVFVMDSLVVLFGSDSVMLIDVAVPVSPQLIGSVQEQYAEGLDRSGDIVVTAGLRGVAWYDWATPAAPQFLKRIHGGRPQDAAVIPPFAYLADDEAGLRVVNVSNPQAPLPVGVLSPLVYEHAEAVAVVGNHAYLAEQDGGVAVVDISNPALPVEVHRVAMLGIYAKSLVASGNFVYVADQDFGLRILDITNPITAYLRASLPGVGQPFGVAVSGDYVFVAGDTALFSVNVSNPDSPYTVNRFEANGQDLREVIVSGGKAYLAYDEVGIEILDISVPGTPVPLGSYLNQGLLPRYLSKYGDHLYMADGTDLTVLNVADPQNMYVVDSFCTPGVASGLVADQGYVWLGDSYAFMVLTTGDGPSCPVAITGDTNANGSVTAADIITSVNYVFKAGPEPLPCVAAADVNCNGAVTSSDIIALVNFVFKSGLQPCDVCLLVPAYWTCP